MTDRIKLDMKEVMITDLIPLSRMFAQNALTTLMRIRETNNVTCYYPLSVDPQLSKSTKHTLRWSK